MDELKIIWMSYPIDPTKIILVAIKKDIFLRVTSIHSQNGLKINRSRNHLNEKKGKKISNKNMKMES